MKIGLDCRSVSDSGGIGEYARQLIKNLIKINSRDQFVLFFTDCQTAENFPRGNAEVEILPLAKFKKYLPFVYSHLLVPLIIRRKHCDLTLFPANIIPFFYFGRSAVVIHDLAVYKFPELFPDQLLNFDRWALVPRSLKRADKIIAVSASTKKDIVELFAVPTEKISVVHEGGNFEFNQVSVSGSLPADLTPKNYFLFVGTIEPRKNLIRLIEAYKKFVQFGNKDFDLVLAGKSGWKNQEIFTAIAMTNQELGQEKIKYLGFVSNQQKAELYRQAFALVLPSLYEGFGLPAAEALRFGLPLVLAGNSALPEIGGKAGIYIDINSAESILNALKELSVNHSLYGQLSSQAYQRAPQFAWETCAQGVLEALQSF